MVQAILGQVTAMLETAAAQLGPATEVEVDALARRAQALIADKVEELASTLPLASEHSSGSSTPRVRLDAQRHMLRLLGVEGGVEHLLVAVVPWLDAYGEGLMAEGARQGLSASAHSSSSSAPQVSTVCYSTRVVNTSRAVPVCAACRLACHVKASCHMQQLVAKLDMRLPANSWP